MRTQKSAGNRDFGRWCACILRGFSGPVAELAATGLTVACEGRMRNRGQVVTVAISVLCNTYVARAANMLHIRFTETASDAHEVQRVSAMVESPRR